MRTIAMNYIISVAIITSLLFSLPLLAKSVSENDKSSMPELSEAETEEGWELLFDGVSADQWRGYNMDTFPAQGWTIEDGVLVFRPVDGENPGPLDIITREKYSDFELSLEWMISEGGNSGIFHHVVEQPGFAVYWSGIEMQLLDNDAHGNLNDSQYAGALYDMKPAVPQNAKPHGEWNSTKILSNGPKMEYWQNGEKVVEFERWTAEWYEMVRGTKFECHPSFGNAPSGHIGLQDHGDEVKFRNIRIRRL
jgi:hypothetical protein